MKKKHNKPLYIISIVSVITILITLNYFDILFLSGMFGRIQHNGIDYYITGSRSEHNLGEDNYDEKIIVYIVDGLGIVDSMHPREAIGFFGDEEHKYLYFDSAIFTRIDELSPERIKQYKIKIRDIEAAKKKLNEVNKNENDKQAKE